MFNINPVKYHTFLVLIIPRLNSILIRSPETISPISKVNSVSTYTRIDNTYLLLPRGRGPWFLFILNLSKVFKFDYDGSCIWKIVNLGGDYMCILSVIAGIN